MNKKSTNTATKRLLRLAGMSSKVTRNVVQTKIKGLFQDEQTKATEQERLLIQVGEELAETLGTMKGAIMKIGQIASQMQDLLPKQVSQALTKLQNAAPAMPYELIEQQIIEQLGDTPNTLFAHFEQEPFAAASIGQVHKATTHTGEKVVVKVQYPGIKASIDSDLSNFKRLLKIAGLLKLDSQVVDSIFNEIRDRLEEELDYEQEAKNIQQFADIYRDEPHVIIPHFHPTLSASEVITLTFEPSDHFNALDPAIYSQHKVNLIARRLVTLVADQVFVHRLLHIDPHPGNFGVRPDGSIVLYDFGATKRFSLEFVENLQDVMRTVHERKLDYLDKKLIKLGIRRKNTEPLDRNFFEPWIELYTEPFIKEHPFNFGETDLHKRIIQHARKDLFYYMGLFQPCADMLLIDRVLLGHYYNLIELGACISLFNEIDHYSRLSLDTPELPESKMS